MILSLAQRASLRPTIPRIPILFGSIRSKSLKGTVRWLAAWICLTTFAAGEPNPVVASNQKFLENNNVRIGVDLSSGGSVFWFSEFPGNRNLLNHADRGRFIQQSYYGKPDGSRWVEKPWRWNPVQGGDYKGKPAKLLEVRDSGRTLYVRSIPVNWAGGEDLQDCRMEQWITLEDQIARIRFRFTYHGKDTHPPTHQEMPAVFVDHALAELVTYKRDAPWTGQPISKESPGWPNEYWKAPENWAGFIGPDGRGLGVFFPGSDRITTYRHPGPDGPQGAGCSYFAPIRTLSITPGLVIEYTVYLTIGSSDEMRARFKSIALKVVGEKSTPAPDRPLGDHTD
jgi:hypothetical protein